MKTLQKAWSAAVANLNDIGERSKRDVRDDAIERVSLARVMGPQMALTASAIQRPQPLATSSPRPSNGAGCRLPALPGPSPSTPRCRP
jgi:hypothetical protein